MSEDERELVRRLLDRGYLDGPAEAVARQAVEQGEENLLPSQQGVFRRKVRTPYFRLRCKWCRRLIALAEFDRWENNGLCAECGVGADED